MVETLDKKLAHSLIDTCTEIEKNKEAFILATIENSLDRIRGYIINIAEMTIDLAVVKENKALTKTGLTS